MGMLLKFLSGLEDLNNPLLGPTLWGLGRSFILGNNAHRKRVNMYVHIFATIFVITHYIELWRIRSDLQAALRNISVSMLSTLCMVKAWTFFAWQKYWTNIFVYVSDVEKRQSTENNKTIKPIISMYTLYARRVTYFYWGLVALTVFTVILAPSVSYCTSQKQRELIKNGSLPYPEILSSWTPFDRTKGSGYWVSVVIHSVITIYGGGIVANYDSNAVVLMTFFKGQLEILSVKCSQIFDDENGTFNAVEARENIRKCHNHHVNLVKYAKILNSLLSPVIFVYVIICSLMICASAIQLNAEGTSSFQRLWILEYLIALIAQLFLYCWHSNEVLYMSKAVDIGVYLSSWWARGYKERRSALLLQGQLRKEIVFMAGPFTQLTVSTFVAIMKGSYSYYTLLSKKDN